MKADSRPTHGQLCVIAREVIEAEWTIDNGEWAERIKCLLVARGFDYPTSHDMTAAMEAVERALEKARGRRPLPRRPIPAPPETPDERPTAEGLAYRDEILSQLSALSRTRSWPASPASTQPKPPDVRDISVRTPNGRVAYVRSDGDVYVETARGWQYMGRVPRPTTPTLTPQETLEAEVARLMARDEAKRERQE